MSLFGFSKRDITPEIGCFLYGYVDDLRSESVHDRLSVSAFYFCDKEESALMISAEVCSINTAVSDRIRAEISAKTGVKKENIILHGIHNHTGPNTDGNTGWGDLDTEYCEGILLPETLKAATEAKASAVPALMGFNMAESRVAVNRREQTVDSVITFGQCPWGSYDPRMAVFSFVTTDKKPIANLIFYTCHGTCAGKCTEISRDFAGGMIDMTEGLSGAPTAFFCGPEGDVGPRLDNGQTVCDINAVEIMGERAGRDAVNIYKGIKEYKPLTLKAVSGALSIPLKKRIPLREAESLFEEYKGHSVNLEGQKRDYYKRVIASYKDGYEDKALTEIPQSAIRLGDYIFVSYPYELFSDIALRIDKAFTDAEVFCLSNANGSMGYFPCDSEISKGGYEIDMFLTQNIQPYCDKADMHLIKETLRILEDLKCTE